MLLKVQPVIAEEGGNKLCVPERKLAIESMVDWSWKSSISLLFFGHFLCQSLTPLPSLPSYFSKKRIVDSFSTVIESRTQFSNMGGACLTDDTLCCSAARSQCITLRFGKGDDKLKRLWIGDFPYTNSSLVILKCLGHILSDLEVQQKPHKRAGEMARAAC